MKKGTDLDVSVRQAITAKKSLKLRWWYMGAPLLSLCAVAGMDRVAIAVVMANKQFLQDLHLIGRPAVTGLLMTGFLLTYALSMFVWGYFIKRFGPRISAIAGVIMWGLTMGLSGLAQTAGALITARIILGIGEGFVFATCNTFVVNWFPPKERGTASSMWLNGQTLGPIIAGLLVVSVINAAGWRMAFYALGALSILIPLPLLIFVMRDRPHQQSHISSEEIKFIEQGTSVKAKEGSQPVEKGSFWRNYRFWLLAAVWGANNIYYYGWATWMPTYFQNARHFSFQAAGYLYSLNWAFTLVTVLVVGYFSDRFMRRAPFGALGYILTGVAMFLGGSVISNNYWALVVLIIAIGCQQPAFLMLHALLQTIVPAKSLSAAVGAAGSIGTFIGMIAPTLAGFLLQVSGFGAVIALLTLTPIICGVLLLVLAREGY